MQIGVPVLFNRRLPTNSDWIKGVNTYGKDYKWQVTEAQTGTYKLTLNTSELENVTLTAEKL